MRGADGTDDKLPIVPENPLPERAPPERTIPGRMIVLPMLVFAAAVVSISAYWLFSHRTTTPAPPPSIAVMPFDSKDPQLGEQIALGVMQKLSGIPGYTVAARDQAFAANGSAPKAIGARLNVRDVLQGSIEPSGDQVKATARLINTSDEFQFWSKVYTGSLPMVEDEIAKAVMETRDLKR